MDLELKTCVWILALSSPVMELRQAPQPTQTLGCSRMKWI